jgi:N-acetylmuramoyl-L-alanine amidase
MIPTNIILHHSATEDSGTVSWSAIRRYHTHELGWTAIGYHFGIELVNDRYEVLMGRMMNVAGAHCKQENMNNKSVGICFVGNFDLKPPEDSLLMVGKNLIRSLMEILRIPKQNIYRHTDFAKYKTCPGTKFPFNEFINAL